MNDVKIIRKDSVPKFFNAIINSNKRLIAPTINDGRTEFAEIKEYDQFAADYIQTVQSAKEVAFPRYDKVLNYKITQHLRGF